MSVFINCLRFNSKAILKDYRRFCLKELTGVTRGSSYGRNVLVNVRNKFRHSSKKVTSLLANGNNKPKSQWASAIPITNSWDNKSNDYKNKVLTIVRREDVATIPNLLCVSRIVLSPFLGYLVLQHNYSYALGIFLFAGVTDLLDGWIARQFPSQKSMLGSFLDPMADKLLVSTLFLSLTAIDLIPIPLTALIISRDVCLMCAGIYIRYVSLPFPKTFSRYFDVTLATANLSPTTVSKVNTLVQLSLVGFTLAASVVDLTGHPWLHGLWYLTAATTVASGASYVFSKDTFKLLRHPHLHRKRLSARRFVANRRSVAQQDN